MAKQYRFSPINNESTFEQVLNYLASELGKLSEKLLDQKFPITTLKIFSHYFEEYDYLYKLLSKMGPKSDFSSETSFYVQVNKRIENYDIKYLGVRVVDPYRLQVGCGDYEIDNFNQFKNEYMNKSPFIRGFDKDMIELWHPDIDVLGYVIPVD